MVRGSTPNLLITRRKTISFLPVFRIHDILVRIRIRIRILLFSSVTFKMSPKNNCFTSFFAFYFLKYILHPSSKIKSHKEVAKQVFLTIFAWRWKVPDPEPDPEPDPYFRLTNPALDPGSPETYGSGTLFSVVCLLTSKQNKMKIPNSFEWHAVYI